MKCFNKKINLDGKVLTSMASGRLKTFLIYFTLITFGYVFLYPLIYSVSMSFMPYEDTVNPVVNLLPLAPTLDNYAFAFGKMDYFPTLAKTAGIAFACALAQTVSCGIIGYGFGKHEFPLKKVFLGLIIAMFIIPPQITSIPLYLTLQKFGLINTPFGLIIPALFGQGLKSTIFILIFYQIFDAMPKVLDEAAQVDGANTIKRFVSISLPLAKPGIVLTFLFSFIWYWNDAYLTTLYLGQKITTLPNQLRFMVASLNTNNMAQSGVQLYQNIEMTGIVLSILPLLIIYLVLQKQFTESIDKTGITGE